MKDGDYNNEEVYQRGGCWMDEKSEQERLLGLPLFPLTSFDYFSILFSCIYHQRAIKI